MREDAQNIQFSSSSLARAKLITVAVDPCDFLWICMSINKISWHIAKSGDFSNELGITNAQNITTGKTH